MKEFELLDWIVFIGYAAIIVFVGLWVSRTKKGEQKTSQDYFLASRSLPWWVIGSTLLAANISAEHFIAMSGSGYAIGLAIAAYEWIAAVSLIIVAKYFLPIFIEKGYFTMPQYLTQRYDKKVSTCFAVFWILVYIFVNLTTVIYLGALAMERIIGIPMIYGIIGFSLFSALYSLYGGMKAVAWTDIINVAVLVFGGLITTAFALNALSDGNGVVAGFAELMKGCLAQPANAVDGLLRTPRARIKETGDRAYFHESLRCLTISNNKMLAAMAALSDSLSPGIGMVMKASARASAEGLAPSASLPTIKASGWRKSVFQHTLPWAASAKKMRNGGCLHTA